MAATIATEVPPRPTGSFTADMIPKAIRAVAEVIATRRGRPQFHPTALGVVLQVKQFSGVLRGVTLGQVGHRDIWLDAATGNWFPDHVSKCLFEWRRVASGPEVQTVPGATHYYSPVGMIPAGRVPAWAAAMSEVPCAGVARDYFRFFKP